MPIDKFYGETVLKSAAIRVIWNIFFLEITDFDLPLI